MTVTSQAQTTRQRGGAGTTGTWTLKARRGGLLKQRIMWEQELAGSRKAAQEEGGTYRLFKARWQGQELSRDKW